MARIRFILVVAFLIGFSPVQQTAVAQSTLAAALDAYEKAVVDKLNSDLETIARAFADARDIQKARRWADWAKFPLDIISAALDLPSFIRDFKSIIAGIENADNQLRLASFFFSLHGISESAGGFKLAITGPEYNKAVWDMLTEANTGTDKKAYQDIISLYLHGIGGRKSPAPIVIETDQGKETLPGVRELKSRLRALLDQAKQEAAAPSASPEGQLKKVIEEVGQATSKVRESKSRHVEISDDVLLGRINPLERVRGEALTRYDRDMKIEQVNTVVSSVKTVCNATSYYLTGGITIGNAKQCAPLRDANTVLKSLTLPYHTSARKQVDQLPFEMLLSLPGEATSLWTVTRTLATKISTTTRAPDQVVGSPATSEPPSTVARPDPADVLRSLAGRWEGKASVGSRFVWTIEEDGRYESTYQEFSRQVKGRGKMWVASDGSIQYRADNGQSGVFTVSRDASGTQVLRGTVSGSRVTYEAKQVEARFTQRREEPVRPGTDTSTPQASDFPDDALSLARKILSSRLIKCGDSWYSRTFSYTGGGQVFSNFFYEYKGITTAEAKPYKLTEADRANGIEWKGELVARSKLNRNYNLFASGRWSIWYDGGYGMNLLAVYRKDGKWFWPSGDLIDVNKRAEFTCADIPR